jgi:hypothetical protein
MNRNWSRLVVCNLWDKISEDGGIGLPQKPKDIVLSKMNKMNTPSQDKKIFKGFFRDIPVKTNKVPAIISLQYDHERTAEKVHEIESKNITILADNLDTAIIHSRFFDSEEYHKEIYTRQLGCLVKWMYTKMPHVEVKEVWEAVAQMIEYEDSKLGNSGDGTKSNM